LRAEGPVQLVVGSNGSGKLRRSFGAKNAPRMTNVIQKN
jgi:hypothetical protein